MSENMSSTYVNSALERVERVFRDHQKPWKPDHVAANVVAAGAVRALGMELYLRYHFISRLKKHFASWCRFSSIWLLPTSIATFPTTHWLTSHRCQVVWRSPHSPHYLLPLGFAHKIPSALLSKSQGLAWSRYPGMVWSWADETPRPFSLCGYTSCCHLLLAHSLRLLLGLFPINKRSDTSQQ